MIAGKEEKVSRCGDSMRYELGDNYFSHFFDIKEYFLDVHGDDSDALKNAVIVFGRAKAEESGFLSRR